MCSPRRTQTNTNISNRRNVIVWVVSALCVKSWANVGGQGIPAHAIGSLLKSASCLASFLQASRYRRATCCCKKQGVRPHALYLSAFKKHWFPTVCLNNYLQCTTPWQHSLGKGRQMWQRQTSYSCVARCFVMLSRTAVMRRLIAEPLLVCPRLKQFLLEALSTFRQSIGAGSPNAKAPCPSVTCRLQARSHTVPFPLHSFTWVLTLAVRSPPPLESTYINVSSLRTLFIWICGMAAAQYISWTVLRSCKRSCGS